MRKNINSIVKYVGTFVLSAGLMLGMTGCGKEKPQEQTTTEAASEEQNSEFKVRSKDTETKTKEIENIINNYFYFDVDSEKREESYYDGLMKGLDDPYSVYYTPEEYAKLKEDDSGEYVGIGATVSKNVETGLVYVVKPLRGSPAEASGLQVGDVFVEIDGQELTRDMELDEVVKLIRGTEGSVAKLKMYREGQSDYINFDVTRAKIQNITVDYEMLDNQIGYISIEQFIENTAAQFKEGMDYLAEQGAKGIVIDLRNNPGGLLSAVIEMADYVIDDDITAEGAEKAGVLLQTKDKNGKVIEEYVCKDGHTINLPMVVLVNGNSASASEIFTGCMKDYKIATIVGKTTYGKGIVQSVIPLTDGSAIKLTIAKYFTPSGADIHKKGVEPDIEVELSDEHKKMSVIPHEEDEQLQKALELFN